MVWVLSLPACANVNEAMEKLTGVSYQTSEQYRDVSTARQAIGVCDTRALINYLIDRNPFAQNDSLFNIDNGMTAQQVVNVEISRIIGERILASMIGKTVEEFHFRKADQSVTLGSRSTVKVKGEPVEVDPQLIFLVAIGERGEDLSSLFKYELCSHPLSLFGSVSLPLQANKAVLADALWKAVEEEQRHPSGNVQYIRDGGALLHRIPWPRGSTYDSVCLLYVRYVTQRYGRCAIVFDGSKDEPSTKDATHLRRTGASTGVTVNFTGAIKK